MYEMLDKYSDSILKNLDKENMNQILKFLNDNNCDFIEDIIDDYLDLFAVDFQTFEEKYNKLNKKYNNQFLLAVKEDMNLLEEFYN